MYHFRTQQEMESTILYEHRDADTATTASGSIRGRHHQQVDDNSSVNSSMLHEMMAGDSNSSRSKRIQQVNDNSDSINSSEGQLQQNLDSQTEELSSVLSSVNEAVSGTRYIGLQNIPLITESTT